MCLAARDVVLRTVKLLRSEVSPTGEVGTLNCTLCVAQNFTAVLPLLHLAKPNFTVRSATALFFLNRVFQLNSPCGELDLLRKLNWLKPAKLPSAAKSEFNFAVAKQQFSYEAISLPP